jgi:tetratricopeptide (TPR) repeat protein
VFYSLFRAELGKYNEAIEYYDRALEVDPNYVNVLNDKSNALYYLGKYNEAIKYYDRALEVDPQHVNALSNREKLLTN